jgi:hypothetical protein
MEWSGFVSMKQHANSQVTLRWFCSLSVSVQTYRLTDLQTCSRLGREDLLPCKRYSTLHVSFVIFNLCRF